MGQIVAIRLAASMTEGRGPGWDAKINSIVAREVFGGYARMFEVHGWPERSEDMMRKVQSRVTGTYGSVEHFAETFKGVSRTGL